MKEKEKEELRKQDFEMNELDSDGTNKLTWYKGTVLVVKNSNINVIVKRDNKSECNSGKKWLSNK